MGLHPLIAWGLATFSIAPALAFENKHRCIQRHEHHVGRRLGSTTRPSYRNQVGRTHANRVKLCIASEQEQITNGHFTEHQQSDPHHFAAPTTQTRKRQVKERRIQFVSWAGKRGMLPHQCYSGVLDYEEYRHWLQQPLPLDKNAKVPTANVDNYYLTASSKSIENAISTNARKTDPPQVTPFHLKPIYIDDHIIVLSKPSGVLSVPGPRRHECVASLAYRYFGKSISDIDGSQIYDSNDDCTAMLNEEIWQPLTDEDNKQIDTMVVHRLDRDTSGVLMFARNDDALKQLHLDFKDKTKQRVKKQYVALVCGHWTGEVSNYSAAAIDEGEIDLPLVRDLKHPPFMRVATAETRQQQSQLKDEQSSNAQNNDKPRHQHTGYLRMVGKSEKPSLTKYRILSYEYLIDNSDCTNTDDSMGLDNSPQLLPVTRVELIPVTGRTHQLRVHCAAVGHPIVGDSIYGYQGEGSPCGGLRYKSMTEASVDLQKKIHNYWISAKQNDFSEERCMLCLHAYRLSIYHPVTESPMIFECAPSF